MHRPKHIILGEKTRPITTLIQHLQISDNQSAALQFFYFVISEIQAVGIFIWLQTMFFQFKNSDPLPSYIYKLSKGITFGISLDSETNVDLVKVKLILSWIYVIISCFIVIYFWFKVAKNYSKSSKTRNILYFILQIHHYFMFYIVNVIMMSILPLQIQQINNNSSSSEKWRVLLGINIAAIAINYALGIISSSFCFDPFYSKNAFASQNVHFQLFTFVVKASMSPVIAFYSSLPFRASLAVIILCLANSGYRVFFILHSFFFYHYKTAKLALFFGGIKLWISFVNLFLIVIYGTQQTSSLNTIYLILLPLPLIIKYLLSDLAKSVESYMWRSAASCNTSRQVLMKIFAYQVFLDKVSIALNGNIPLNREELLFMGISSEHSSTCTDSRCLCSYFFKGHHKSQVQLNVSGIREQLSVYIYKMSFTCLEEGICRIKENSNLKVFLANLIVTKSPDNLRPALSYLFSTADDKLGLYGWMKKMTLQHQVQQRINTITSANDGYKIDMVKFVGYHQATTNFCSQIVEAVDKYVSFWEEYRKTALKMVKVVEKSEAIEELAEIVDSLWKKYTEKYEYFFSVMHSSYCLYLNLVRNAPFASQEISLRSISHKNLRACSTKIVSKYISELDLVSSQLMSFYISMSKERAGKILYVSENIEEFLGYVQQEIIGKNLDYLMPPHLVGRHDAYLHKHLEESQNFMSKDYDVHEGFMKTNKNTIKLCVAHITIFPYLNDELVYISAVKVIPTKSEYLFIDDMGFITSFSAGIASTLQLKTHNKIHIKDICIDVEKMNVIFNTQRSLIFNKSRKITHYSKILDNLPSDRDLMKTNRNQSSNRNELSTEPVDLVFIRQGDDIFMVKYKTQITQLDVGNTVYMLTLDCISSVDGDETARKNTKNLDISIEIITSSSEMDVPHEIKKKQEIPIFPKEMKAFTDDSPTYTLSPDYSARNLILNTALSALRVTETHENILQNSNILISPSPLLHLHADVDGSISNENIDSHRKFIPKRKDLQQIPETPKFNGRITNRKPSEKSSVTSNTSNTYPKLEKAVYSIPANKYLNSLRCLGSLYLIICIILCVFLLFKIQHDLDLVKGNLSILTASNLRLQYITGLNRLARSLSLTIAGLISSSRYYYTLGVPDVLNLMYYLIQDNLQHLNNENSMVRIALDSISQSLRKQFYLNLIPVLSQDQNMPSSLNTFDLASALAVRAQRLTKITSTTLPSAIPDIDFILNNTMNGLLVQSEEITDIVMDDSFQKLESITNLTMYAIIICCVCGAIVISTFCYQQFKLAQSRNRLIEVFASLDKNEIEENIRHVKIMKSKLTRIHLGVTKSKSRDVLSRSFRKKSNQTVKTEGRVRSIPVNLNGINAKIYKMIISIILLCQIMLAPFLIINAIVIAKNQTSAHEINTIQKINRNLYDMTIITVSIYEYVQFNGTTIIRNNPIGEEWEAAFQRSSNSINSLAELAVGLTHKSSKVEEEVGLFLTGDLCKIVPSISETCIIFKPGTVDKGIIGINSFFLSVLRDMKDTFDLSDKSFTSAQKVLNTKDLILSEAVYLDAQMPAYQAFSQVIQSQAESHFQEAKNALLCPVIVAIVAYLITALFVGPKLVKPFEKERGKWKKMLRKVPFNIVITNKLLKAYLAKEAIGSREFINLKL